MHEPHHGVVPKRGLWSNIQPEMTQKLSGLEAPHRFWHLNCEHEGLGISQNYFLWCTSFARQGSFFLHVLSGLAWQLWTHVPRMRLTCMVQASFATWTVELISSLQDVLSVFCGCQDVWESYLEWSFSGSHKQSRWSHNIDICNLCLRLWHIIEWMKKHAP